ncbi:telomere length regulation protein-domain-containing protein [Paraphoma chrysanthemicola]|uniref:Telomere length regulation protein-domain-containing protein n=1 Tax=Paraphoma chrysanthemicola TaxID=798071 RepID=A0A8K0R5R0_9PLEO|nr:telomere length regulation protein-domain-containing protein [Paraphoma chrysanthemicola]
MSDFLTAVSTKKVKGTEPLLQEVKSLSIQPAPRIESPESTLEALKHEPSSDTVVDALTYMTSDGFSLILPEPLNASIAYQLVNDTFPHYWRTFSQSRHQKSFAKILQNPTGIGHIITRLRSLIADSRRKQEYGEARDPTEHIVDLLAVLEGILQDEQTSRLILRETFAHSKKDMQRKLIWREYIVQIASGRVIALVAEAEDVLKSKDISRTPSWIAEGRTYAEWLGRNIAALITDGDSKNEESSAAVVELCSKALNLGYTDHVVGSIISALLKTDSVEQFGNTMRRMKLFEQRKYLNAVIAFTIKQYFPTDIAIRDDSPIPSSKTVSGVACLLHELTKDNEPLKDQLVSLGTRSTIPALDDSLSARRSVIAAVAQDDDKLHNLLEASIKMFGDSVYIKHTPVLQQEALAQNLALCSGYVQRSQPMFLTMMAKSSYHVNGMSNRIGASSARTRFLGIVAGIAISKMVDKPELQLKFELEGAEASEAGWYERLTQMNDELGKVADLKVAEKSVTPAKKTKPKVKIASSTKPSITEISGPRIVEVLSDSEDEDTDLIAYEKPDSDPEDSDDDPTVVTRNKPTAPVYIRDLIAGLRDEENYDRHALALSTAAALIRRKANFGTEVTDHLEELATILTGLQDSLELEAFAQQRQQALIAVLLARPAQMAQWFARSFFSGDYSFTQRTAMLTTLGLGARELAGIKDSSTSDLIPPASSFPSKQLPPHLHKIYAETQNANPVMRISSHMAREMLSPLASQAADHLSGPNILKVRTFSSRMQVEAKRQKPVPNALAQIVADNFFFPLTGRWWMQVRANNDSIYTSPHLLPPFLQTLSLLLNASGPNALALAQMTREYWDLLLSVRGLAAKDKLVLNAVLFGFLMVLETNENKERVATELGKELLETQAWVQMVFKELGAGSEEDERVRGLAAGVVVRCQEVVEKYQRRMAGAMMDY